MWTGNIVPDAWDRPERLWNHLATAGTASVNPGHNLPKSVNDCSSFCKSIQTKYTSKKWETIWWAHRKKPYSQHFYNLLMLPLPFLSSSTNGPRERHFQQLLYNPGINFLTEYKNIVNRCHTVLKPAERSPEWQLDLKSIQFLMFLVHFPVEFDEIRPLEVIFGTLKLRLWRVLNIFQFGQKISARPI